MALIRSLSFFVASRISSRVEGKGFEADLVRQATGNWAWMTIL
jgi:hypothetical protein